jgi:two-component sensor histidine kinase
MRNHLLTIFIGLVTLPSLIAQESQSEEALLLGIEQAKANSDFETEFELSYKLTDKYIFSSRSKQAIEMYEYLKAKAQSLNQDSLYCEAIIALCQMYMLKNDYTKSDSLTDIILNQDAPLLSAKGTAYIYKGQIDIELGHYKEAEKNLLKYIEIFTKLDNQSKLGVGYSTLGKLFQKQGNIETAIEYLLKSVDYQESAHYTQIMGRYKRLGELYVGQANYYKAKEYIDLAIKICEEKNIQRTHILNLMTKAEIYFLEHNIKDAVACYEAAHNLMQNEKFKNLSFYYFVGMSKANLFKEDFERAGIMVDSIIDLRPELRLEEQLLKYYTTLAEYYIKTKNYTKSKRYLDSSFLSMADNEDIRLKQKLNFLAYQFYKNTNQITPALNYLEKSQIIKDSLYRSDQMTTVHELEAIYNKAEQDKQINELNVANEITSLKLSQQKLITSISLIALSLLSILLYSIFSLNKKLKIQNQVIQKNVEEKDTLLREIHHRVKNNLQFISSLLKLQSRHVEDPNALSALKEGQDRVKSMALIHQNLYQEENLTGVDLKNYFEKLSSNLFYSYNIEPEKIKLKLEIEDINLDVDSVIPIGLIVNELISNALKYAFPGEKEGFIGVRLREFNNKLELTISDNGVGMTKENQDKMDASFGYRMINTFKSQLEADLLVNTDNGTSVTLLINDYKKSA